MSDSALSSDIGSSDIRISPISLITNIGLSAHLCLNLYFIYGHWFFNLNNVYLYNSNSTFSCISMKAFTNEPDFFFTERRWHSKIYSFKKPLAVSKESFWELLIKIWTFLTAAENCVISTVSYRKLSTPAAFRNPFKGPVAISENFNDDNCNFQNNVIISERFHRSG